MDFVSTQVQVSSKLALVTAACGVCPAPIITRSITVTESEALRAVFITASADFTWEQCEMGRRKLDLISCTQVGQALCEQASIANNG